MSETPPAYGPPYEDAPTALCPKCRDTLSLSASLTPHKFAGRDLYAVRCARCGIAGPLAADRPAATRAWDAVFAMVPHVAPATQETQRLDMEQGKPTPTASDDRTVRCPNCGIRVFRDNTDHARRWQCWECGWRSDAEPGQELDGSQPSRK